MLTLIEQHQQALTALCQTYGVQSLALFGSAAHGQFNPATSDLDFVVEFQNFTLENAADRYLGLLVDLENLFGRKIDLVCYSSIKNPFFKQVVDQTRVRLYAA